MAKNFDLNRLNEIDLQRIGIRKEQAIKIINDRAENGPFQNWDDLKRVGFTDEMIDNLKLDGLRLDKVA